MIAGASLATLVSRTTSTFRPRISHKLFNRTFLGRQSDFDMQTDINDMTKERANVEYDVIKEGSAQVFQPKSVFYNPVQEFNRDVSTIVLNQYIQDGMWKYKKRQSLHQEGPGASKGVRILEALSATGLRSIRYANEVDDPSAIGTIHANDLSASAVEMIRKNIEHNGVGHKVEAFNEDATSLMYRTRRVESQERYDVIDIDPYGSAAPFLDAAVQAIRDSGLLMVTCTDMAVLCGNHAETAFAKYGSFPLHEEFCHEQALRVLLHSIDSHATRYGRYIVPLVSLSIDFYIRIFVQVFTSPLHAKESAYKKGLVYNCVGCHSHHYQPLAKRVENPRTKTEADKYLYKPARGPPVGEKCDCGSSFSVGGPIWLAPIHNESFVVRLLSRLRQMDPEKNPDAPLKFTFQRRIYGMLTLVSEELQDVPLYYTAPDLHQIMHAVGLPRKTLTSAILNAGYRVSYSHANPKGLKTDAPKELLWDIFREWINSDADRKQQWLESNGTPGDDKVPKNDAGKCIYYSERRSSSTINFADHPDADPPSKKQNLLRFQQNFPANWGPKAKARAPVNVKKLAEQVESVSADNGDEGIRMESAPKKTRID